MSIPFGNNDMAALLELLTHNGKQGTGYFDVLMRSMATHLADEKESGRISPSEYATSYVELASVTLQGAINYLIQAPEAMQRAKLAGVQIEIANKELDLKDKELEIKKEELEQAKKQNELLEEQRRKLIAETEQIIQNTANAKEQGKALVHETKSALFKAQAMEYRAWAEHAVVKDLLPDGTPIGGSLGKDNKVKDAQATSFKARDIFQMVQSLQSSNTAQITTLQEADIAPNFTTGKALDNAVTKYFSELGIVVSPS